MNSGQPSHRYVTRRSLACPRDSAQCCTAVWLNQSEAWSSPAWRIYPHRGLVHRIRRGPVSPASAGAGAHACSPQNNARPRVAHSPHRFPLRPSTLRDVQGERFTATRLQQQRHAVHGSAYSHIIDVQVAILNCPYHQLSFRRCRSIDLSVLAANSLQVGPNGRRGHV